MTGRQSRRGAVLPLSFLAATSCCCYSRPEEDDRFAVDPARAAAEDRLVIQEIYGSPTVVADSEIRSVRSSWEIYDFLMEELPFAADCVRVMNRGKYVIERTGPGAFRVDDKDGLVMDMRKVYRDDVRWVYLGFVRYRSGLFGEITARSVFVVVAEGKDGVLTTQLRAFARFESFLRVVADLLPGIFQAAMQRRSRLFIDAAQTVAEAAGEDARKFWEAMRASGRVDPEALERFRARFVK